MRLDQQCQSIELILCDVDGVLTDGTLAFDNQGIETKRFHARDGFGIRLWQRAGGRFGLLTSRTSQIVKMRAADLEVDLVRQGVEEKLPAAREVLDQLQLEPKQMCYIGDDLPDLPVLRTAGLGIAVADAGEEVRQAADYTTSMAGGRGAVREAIEMILRNQGRWDQLIQRFVSP